MIAEAGLAALWFAAALALLQLVMAAIGVARSQSYAAANGREARHDSTTHSAAVGSEAVDQMLATVRPVAVVQGVLVVLAMLLLIAVFVNSDMSVKQAAEDSSAT